MTPSFKAVVVGASAGGVEALGALLAPLPQGFPLPICVVLHTPPDRESVLPELMRQRSVLAVCEAESGMTLAPGTVYFAPPDYHLLVEQNATLSLSSEEPVLFSRPSADVLFETAADAFGEALLGVVLTGASADGSRGLRAVIDAGGRGLVQAPQEAYARTMPESAMALCPEAECLPVAAMARYLEELAQR